MDRKKLVGLLLSVLVLAGCGGGAPKQAYTPADRGDSRESTSRTNWAAPEEAPASDAKVAPPAAYPQTASVQPVAPSGGAAAEARAPSPASRPGLGTEWGERRDSRVHDVSFVRDATRPFAVATLNYDDGAGVEALASRAARRETWREVPAGDGAVTVSIRDASGEPLEAVHVGDRTFVVGHAGERYSIVLTNHTGHRFEAVATVDGLDVINGRTGSLDNRGYFLLPFATLEIEGFRQSANAVAAFRFAAVADSYAAQRGNARNVGVIGVALFAERGDAVVSERELRLRETASPFPADPRFAPPPPRRW